MLNIKKIFTISISLIGLLWAIPAFAQIPTMTVSEIHPGMTGIGRTVISGTEIEEFDVEVIDVFTNLGYDGGPLIFIRISGDVVNRSGGIAGGYSGSPVYIDGRMIGAVSWGPWFTEGDVCGVTPIDNMLRAFSYENVLNETIASVPECLDTPVQVAGQEYNSILLADLDENPAELVNLWGEGTLVMTPVKTPLMVSGLTDAGLERLREFAEERLPYMDIMPGPGGGASEGVPILMGPTVLEPGASVGAQLATGDLDLTAVGTLTWVGEDGRFLAFGHPFLSDGATNLPFCTTRIVYTMPALDRSYKMGEPIEVVGTVTQDRTAMIAGHLRQVPEMVEFNLEVIDKDLDRTRRYNYSVINKEDWLPMLGWMMPMEGIMYAIDRTGRGTCDVSFSIRGEGLAEPIERHNRIYASYDIASESLGEFMEALNITTTMNPYREVRITTVDITVEVTAERHTLDITRARFNNAPNMGPGAVGYTGPQTTGEETGDIQDLVEGQTLPEESEIQDIPLEEEMVEYMNEMMETFESTTTQTLVGYYPGDIVEILVTLRPWRDKTVDRIIQLEIPKDFPVGQTTIDIMGGGAGYYMYYDMSGGYYSDSGYYIPPEDLDEVIENFVTRDVNNSILVRLNRVATGTEDPYFYLQDKFEEAEPVEATMVMDEVVNGWFSLPIEILSADGVNAEEIVLEEGSTEAYDYYETQTDAGSSESSNPHRN